MKKKNKLVYGVGINDVDYPVIKKENGKNVWMCPYYRTWTGMLQRAYSDKLKQKRPTYEDVTVCEEWGSFMRFREWMETQDWKGKHLDKDILFQGNKVYSPDTCVFVDGVVNNFILDSAASRGEWPLGVSWHEQKQKFISSSPSLASPLSFAACSISFISETKRLKSWYSIIIDPQK